MEIAGGYCEMMLGADTTNNMSGFVYSSGWFLIGMGVHIWPILFWGPLGILCAIYTLVGGVWTYDTLNRWKAERRTKLMVMLGVPIVMLVLAFLIPADPNT
jgi:hypothetical protein